VVRAAVAGDKAAVVRRRDQITGKPTFAEGDRAVAGSAGIPGAQENACALSVRFASTQRGE